MTAKTRQKWMKWKCVPSALRQVVPTLIALYVRERECERESWGLSFTRANVFRLKEHHHHDTEFIPVTRVMEHISFTAAERINLSLHSNWTTAYFTHLTFHLSWIYTVRHLIKRRSSAYEFVMRVQINHEIAHAVFHYSRWAIKH